MYNQFFHLKKKESFFLIGNLVYAIVAFLPFWSDKIFWGLSATGWLLAIFMVISPLIALWIFLSDKSNSDR
mgnify:CR=1 FL=1|jgi:hypothetical protein|tara:strand:+ start:367 stop:579 length:213 start_codon:yes stop_codon:yes gene_type:complete